MAKKSRPYVKVDIEKEANLPVVLPKETPTTLGVSPFYTRFDIIACAGGKTPQMVTNLVNQLEKRGALPEDLILDAFHHIKLRQKDGSKKIKLDRSRTKSASYTKYRHKAYSPYALWVVYVCSNLTKSCGHSYDLIAELQRERNFLSFATFQENYQEWVQSMVDACFAVVGEPESNVLPILPRINGKNPLAIERPPSNNGKASSVKEYQEV